MRKLEELFSSNEVLENEEKAVVSGGAIFFDSRKKLYINGIEVDAWTFRLALMGFDVAMPAEDDGGNHEDDMTIVDGNSIQTNY
jgi:hypothetical protein